MRIAQRTAGGLLVALRSSAVVRALAVLAVLAVLVADGIPAGATVREVRGTLALSGRLLVPGSSVSLGGVGWTPNSVLQASLCGDDALNGSADCAVTSAATFSAGPGGAISGTMRILLPPVPCPCVVLVLGLQPKLEEKFTVAVKGARTAPLTRRASAAVPPRLVLSASVVSESGFTAWMGGPAARTVLVTLRNESAVASVSFLIARWGTAPDPSSVISTGPRRLIPPGGTFTERLPFDLAAFAFGHYQVVVEASGPQGAVLATATTGTSADPFGVVLLGILVVLALILLIVTPPVRTLLQTRKRRRQSRAEIYIPGISTKGGVSRPVTGSGALGLGTLSERESVGIATVVSGGLGSEASGAAAVGGAPSSPGALSKDDPVVARETARPSVEP